MDRIQPSLEVGSPDTRYEREADRVADRVMRMSGPGTTHTSGGEGPDRIQRMCSRCQRRYRQGKPLNCEECEAELQRQESSATTPAVGQAFSRHVQSLRGTGFTLDGAARSFAEPRFGQDFSDVRVHTGRRADVAARAVNATAFTLGRDIVFRSGAYRPNTASGRRLLAHELTHVVQQRGDRPRTSGPTETDSPGGRATGPGLSGSGGAPTLVQRRCQNGTWLNECDGCSMPRKYRPLVADKDNPTGHPETVFGHQSSNGLCKAEHTAPCDNHDRCYQRCASVKTGGEWQYNWQHKEECDQIFLEEMQAVCEAAGDPEGSVSLLGWNPNCSTFARVYHEAVSWRGQDAFRERQREACRCRQQRPAPNKDKQEDMQEDKQGDKQRSFEFSPMNIEGNVHEVVRGDTLWDIAEQEYGDGRKWPVIFERNEKGPDNPNGIEDPDLIYPGQVLVIPPKSEAEQFDRSEYRRPGRAQSR